MNRLITLILFTVIFLSAVSKAEEYWVDTKKVSVSRSKIIEPEYYLADLKLNCANRSSLKVHKSSGLPPRKLYFECLDSENQSVSQEETVPNYQYPLDSFVLRKRLPNPIYTA